MDEMCGLKTMPLLIWAVVIMGFPGCEEGASPQPETADLFSEDVSDGAERPRPEDTSGDGDLASVSDLEEATSLDLFMEDGELDGNGPLDGNGEAGDIGAELTVSQDVTLLQDLETAEVTTDLQDTTDGRVPEISTDPRLDTGSDPVVLIECSDMVPGAIIVDTLEDGLIDDGQCGLREAIEASNLDVEVDSCVAGSGDDVVQFAVNGLFLLSSTGAGEDNNLTGDLDITDTVQLLGCGPLETVLDGGGEDRIFDVQIEGRLEIAEMTLQNGVIQGDGGTIPGGGDWGGTGGAVMNRGFFSAAGCIFQDNLALGGQGSDGARPGAGGGGGGGSAMGGAIYNEGGTVILSDGPETGCLLTGNRATGGAGGYGPPNDGSFTGQGGGGGGASGGNGGNGSGGSPGGMGGGGGGGAGEGSSTHGGGMGGFGGGGGGGGGNTAGGFGGLGGGSQFGGGSGGQGCCSGAGGGAGGAGLGGAIFTYLGNLTLAGCELSANVAEGGAGGSNAFGGGGTEGGGYGGAIFLRESILDTTEVTYPSPENTATTEGVDLYEY